MRLQQDAVTQSPDPWYGEPEFKLPRPPHELEKRDKTWRGARFEELRQQLYRGRSGLEVSLAMTEVTDEALISIFEKQTATLRPKLPFAVVAIGGYGAGQIAPLSDVELRIVSGVTTEIFQRKFPRLTQLRDEIDALGLKWDHGIQPTWFPSLLRPGYDGMDHPPGPFNKQPKIRWVETMTSLLNARLLYGEPQIFLEYQEAIHNMVRVNQRELLGAMREGRTKLRDEYGEHDTTPHNLKKSGGGLRDSNFIDWECRIGMILGKTVLSNAELTEFKELQGRQLAVKHVLHFGFGPGRPDENRLYTLTDEKIALLPFKLGSADPVRDAARILDHSERVYFETAARISHLADKVHRAGDWIFGFAGPSAIETEADRLGMEISEKRVRNVPADEVVALVLKAYRRWQERLVPGSGANDSLRRTTSWNSLLDSLDPLSREIEHSAYRSSAVAAAFQEILADAGRAAPALERLSRAGFLAELSPSVGATRHVPLASGRKGQTIDGHTFESLAQLDRVFADEKLQDRLGVRELLSSLSTESRAEMVFALLEHDTGLVPGRTKSHAEIGQALAIRDARSLGFSEQACQRIGNLVLNHSYLSRTAQGQPLTKNVIEGVTKRIADEQMLLQTFLIDWADNASSPPFAASKEASLTRLFARTRDRLVKGERFMEALSVSGEEVTAFANTLRTASVPPLTNADLVTHLKGLPEDYALNTDPKIIAAQLALTKEIELRDAAGAATPAPLFRWLPAADERSRILVFAAPDATGIFARIAGALAENRLNIEDARIATRRDVPIACDAFTIPFTFDVEQEDLARVQSGILNAYNRPDLVEKIWEKRPSMKSAAALPSRGIQRGKLIELQNDPASEGTNITVKGTGDYPGLAAVFGYAISKELGCSIVHADLGGGGQRITNHFLVVTADHQPIPAGDFENVEKVLLRAMLKDEPK